MPLKKYKAKRKFNQSPEPSLSSKKSRKPLQFVVQKHYASHLHYDFRLEMHGVLKSWAIPKGPSMNPHDKRLAVMVEDHPYDYKDFEGTIPPGNYGAGTVIIWDEGTYEPLNEKITEKILSKDLEQGHLSFKLHGHKLNGEFSLVKIKGRNYKASNSWLLVKKNDEFASTEDILKRDVSVRHDPSLEKKK